MQKKTTLKNNCQIGTPIEWEVCYKTKVNIYNLDILMAQTYFGSQRQQLKRHRKS